jgi:hypothetical protein
MTPAEKLECPLLRCTKRFPDHESMLRHLACCTYLASGEYWCYDHMRVERFDDVKCKRCLGHPSKRRKMMSMAKSFFHSLGHKSKKGNGRNDFSSEDAILPPPPSYDSIGMSTHITELCATEIVEIDSTELVAIPDEPAIDPQALLVPELDSSVSASDGTFMPWQPLPTALTSFEQADLRIQSGRPSLQVNTLGLQGGRQVPRPPPRPTSTTKGLSPSSSVRSTTSTTSNVSSLISPVSNWSGAWSLGSGFNTSLTSPVDLVSPALLADNPFAVQSGKLDDTCPNFLHEFFSELPADVPESRGPGNLSPDNHLLSLDVQASAVSSFSTNMVSTEDSVDILDLGGDDSVIGGPDDCCSDTKALVESSWDALQAHILSSMLKIQHVTHNPLADHLRSMSPRSIANAGLAVLRSLLDGNDPPSAIDMLCFIHLVYAFTLTTHEQETSTRTKNLFLHSLSYASRLPACDRNQYTELIFAIWHPSDVSQEDISRHFSTAASKGKQPATSSGSADAAQDDALLSAAFDFLDGKP